MERHPSLSDIVAAFASVDGPEPLQCAQAFGCVLEEVEAIHRTYAVPVPHLGLSWLELRIARNSSSLIARVDPEWQEAWARERSSLGSPVHVSVVSPQFPPPAHMPRRWGEVYVVEGMSVSFGFEGERTRPRLTGISRGWA